MVDSSHLPFAIQVLSLLLLMGLGIVSWRYRPRRGAVSLAALMAAAAMWATGSILSFVSTTLFGNLLATRISYLGVSLLPVAWLLLAMEYAGYEERISARVVGLLLVVPTITQLLAWTNQFHVILWDIHGLTTVNGSVVLLLDHGPWFLVHTVYSYLLLALGTAIFLRAIVHTQRIYQRQVTLALAAVAVPWASNYVYLFDVVSISYDPTPFLFSVSGGLLFVALFRFRLLDLAPIARDAVMEAVEDGVVVLDERDRIVDINPSGEKLLGVAANEVIGKLASDVFPSQYAETYQDVFDKRERIAAPFLDGERFVDLQISPLYGRTGRLHGRVLILRDVTTEERQKRKLEDKNRELEQHNEKLERFASIASHDLRNPLNVAQGHLQLLADEYESEHVEHIERAHSRMGDLIADLLTLARHGQSVGAVESLPLHSVVVRSTSPVEEDTTLEIEGDLGRVEADPGRLEQLFENLFRNTVEHGDSETTTWVGRLDDRVGFYVEDDGSGIPPDERDRVFEFGYSDSPSGTGLGLAIVHNIVQAHGWEISITSGRTGGARFEIVTEGTASRNSTNEQHGEHA